MAALRCLNATANRRHRISTSSLRRPRQALLHSALAHIPPGRPEPLTAHVAALEQVTSGHARSATSCGRLPISRRDRSMHECPDDNGQSLRTWAQRQRTHGDSPHPAKGSTGSRHDLVASPSTVATPHVRESTGFGRVAITSRFSSSSWRPIRPVDGRFASTVLSNRGR